MFLFTNIQDHDMLDLTFDSNFQCIWLENQVHTSNMEEHIQKLLSLKQLNFRKNINHSSKDLGENLTDPTCFYYYLTHDFHKLNIKNKRNKHNSFSIFHSNISSLKGNFLKMEEVLHNDDNNFDLIALTETWHTYKNLFTLGILTGYQKYVVPQKMVVVDFILKKLSLISFMMIYPKNIRAKKVILKYFGLK